MPITALDWDPNYNRILSCSEDCNAYVWNYENGSWTPTLVVLKIKRAALCCKWSPDGRAFAVGSSGKKGMLHDVFPLEVIIKSSSYLHI